MSMTKGGRNIFILGVLSVAISIVLASVSLVLYHNSGDVYANFFAHQPYQDAFNADNGTHLVTIAGVHVEPMGLYAGKQADLTALGISE